MRKGYYRIIKEDDLRSSFKEIDNNNYSGNEVITKEIEESASHLESGVNVTVSGIECIDFTLYAIKILERNFSDKHLQQELNLLIANK